MSKILSITLATHVRAVKHAGIEQWLSVTRDAGRGQGSAAPTTRAVPKSGEKRRIKNKHWNPTDERGSGPGEGWGVGGRQ